MRPSSSSSSREEEEEGDQHAAARAERERARFRVKTRPPFFLSCGEKRVSFSKDLTVTFCGMEERDDEEAEEEEDASRRGGRRVGRRALPSKRAIDAAFEHLRQSGKGKARRATTDKDDDDDDDAGLSYRNLRDACDAFGFHHWTEADVENMIDAYELSESKGEIALVDINQSRRPSRRDDDDDDEKKKKKNPSREMVAEVTKKGFLEIVRRCGAREAR